MGIGTTAGARIYIGTTAEIDWTTDNAALIDFEADTYKEIGEVESLGEYGDESADVTFTSIGDSRTRHLKGSRDAGTLALVCGRDPHDEGQQAARSAEKTKFQYNFKIVYEDAPSALYTDSVEYFRGNVMSARTNAGGADDVTKTSFNIGITSAILEVPSELVGS